MENAYKRIHRIALALLCCAVAAVAYVYAKEAAERLEVHFLDVGQGDAIYVRAPGGRDMLVDSGPSNIVLRRLSEAMPWYDRSIDIVVATHPDADHIGGLPEVMKRYRIGVMLEPGVESENGIDDEILRLSVEKSIDRILAREGMRVDLGGGAVFDILFPYADASEYETNAASIVGRLAYGSTSVMLTGDSPRSIEGYLVSRFGSALGSDVLKVGHHGSRTSSSESFVRAVAPRFSVVSAGKDNRYGHPHRETLDVLRSSSAEVLETAESGTVVFVSDGRSIRREK